MVSTAVIDASAAVKWFIVQPLTPNALAVLQQYPTRLAPRLIVAELGNALWKYVRSGQSTAAQAETALQQLSALYVSFEEDGDYAQRAMQIAADLDHPFYDCLYLAVAEARGCPLITDDQRLLGKLARKRRFKLIALADIA